MSEQKKQIEKLSEINHESVVPASATNSNGDKSSKNGRPLFDANDWQSAENENKSNESEGKTAAKTDPFANRQPIIDVLRDIYDNK